jgi:hypothetical protein
VVLRSGAAVLTKGRPTGAPGLIFGEIREDVGLVGRAYWASLN